MIVYERTYRERLHDVGERARGVRVSRKLRQEDLAERAGIGVATVIRFEKTGRASFENVLRIAMALRAEGAFDKLFEVQAYTSLDEALGEPKTTTPQRVRRRQ